MKALQPPRDRAPKPRRCPVRDAMFARVREAEAEMWHEQLDARRADAARGLQASTGPSRGPARKRYQFLLNEYMTHTGKHGC